MNSCLDCLLLYSPSSQVPDHAAVEAAAVPGGGNPMASARAIATVRA